MKIIKCSHEILTPLNKEIGVEIIKHIEKIARTCYKSEDAITKESGERMIAKLVSSGHLAMLEHFSISVKFYTDRGVSHEIVRHRMASYAQESTRYCDYDKAKFDNQITVIDPKTAMGMKEMTGEHVIQCMNIWCDAMKCAETNYQALRRCGCPPEMARSVLPNSLKTEIVVTMNLREWIHFFNLRVLGTTGKPHPQMYEVAKPVLYEFAEYLPCIFGRQVELLENGMDCYSNITALKGGLMSAT